MNFAKGSTNKARNIAKSWIDINCFNLRDEIVCGLPEYNDRIDEWQVPLVSKISKDDIIGEIKIDREITRVIDATNVDILLGRLNKLKVEHNTSLIKKPYNKVFRPTPIPNKIILGDAVNVLEEYPPDSVQLVVTSPPYFNAKPEYSEYVDYQEYLDFLRKVIVRCAAILSEGRFFVINVSPVLVKRTSRNTSSND